jgi:hypothetical protein
LVFIGFDIGFDAAAEIVGRAHLFQAQPLGERGEDGGDRGPHGFR